MSTNGVNGHTNGNVLPALALSADEAGKNKLDDFLVDTPGAFTHLLSA
mgnify:CR=1 FL=1